MQTAEARSARGEDREAARGRPGLGLLEPEDREAVLLQWEAKIESAERSPGARRFVRADQLEDPAGAAEPQTAAGPPAPGKAEAQTAAGAQQPLALAQPAPERRTVVISGQPYAARRRATLAERHIAARPDSIALWAFLLGLLLVAVAAGSAHA